MKKELCIDCKEHIVKVKGRCIPCYNKMWRKKDFELKLEQARRTEAKEIFDGIQGLIDLLYCGRLTVTEFVTKVGELKAKHCRGD